jgi:hypothetical protein
VARHFFEPRSHQQPPRVKKTTDDELDARETQKKPRGGCRPGLPKKSKNQQRWRVRNSEKGGVDEQPTAAPSAQRLAQHTRACARDGGLEKSTTSAYGVYGCKYPLLKRNQQQGPIYRPRLLAKKYLERGFNSLFALPLQLP